MCHCHIATHEWSGHQLSHDRKSIRSIGISVPAMITRFTYLEICATSVCCMHLSVSVFMTCMIHHANDVVFTPSSWGSESLAFIIRLNHDIITFIAVSVFRECNAFRCLVSIVLWWPFKSWTVLWRHCNVSNTCLALCIFLGSTVWHMYTCSRYLYPVTSLTIRSAIRWFKLTGVFLGNRRTASLELYWANGYNSAKRALGVSTSDLVHGAHVIPR